MPLDSPVAYRPPSLVLSRVSLESLALATRGISASGSASAAWGTNNLGIIIPFNLVAPTKYVDAFIYNGATASGNVDVGVYDQNYSKIVSTGAIAQSGTSQTQVLALADTLLAPGQYYLALSCSLSTATVFSQVTTGPRMASVGCAQMASAHPLPATFVPATYAQTLAPDFGLTQRSFL